MRRILPLVAVIALLASSASAKQQAPKEDFAGNLRKATVAVYQGKQVCENQTVLGYFDEPEQEWGCKFKSRFTCTGTVIQAAGTNYLGLTAGHCFDWDKKDEYYISETVGEKPVLKKIKLVKFENDERYDYAVFTFSSGIDYPAVPVELDSPGPVLETEIINVNFAFGLVKQTTHGLTVSEIITTPAVKGTEDLKGRFLVNIGVGPGASGSAVVDKNTGKIIGIVEAIFPATQMPTVVMPTGKSLVNFMEDDSAGIAPQKQPVPTGVHAVKHLSTWESFLALLHKWFLGN